MSLLERTNSFTCTSCFLYASWCTLLRGKDVISTWKRSLACHHIDLVSVESMRTSCPGDHEHAVAWPQMLHTAIALVQHRSVRCLLRLATASFWSELKHNSFSSC